MKKFLKTLLTIVIVLVVAFALFVGYAVLSDYQPDAETTVYQSKSAAPLPDSLTYSALIWNIGYCGLSSGMDFFYDGGENVRPEKNTVENNLKTVVRFLEQHRETDFILLQEVDKRSKRSYRLNQYDTIAANLFDHTPVFGKNYDVFFVPLPLSEPMGSVLSGLASYSKYEPQNSVRHSFPGNYAFPKGLFMLDRCFLVNRYPLSNGNDLLVINTHNSAYDDGSLRKGQMDYLKSFLTNEYKAGNYIVAGGDWNQCPPGFEPQFTENVFDTTNLSYIDNTYLPAEWKWCYQANVPTNRRVATTYTAGSTPTTVIDFFLISPNIEMEAVENIHLNFENSDHQPVKLTFRLKP